MGPIGYPETSVSNFQSTLGNIPEKYLIYRAAEAWSRALYRALNGPRNRVNAVEGKEFPIVLRTEI